MGQKRGQDNEHIRGRGWEEVLDDDGERDHRIDQERRPGREPREQVFDQRASTTATANTAIPSPRPTNPMPSLVFAFIPTASGAMPSSPAIACAIALLYTPSRGFSHTMVTSAWTG